MHRAHFTPFASKYSDAIICRHHTSAFRGLLEVCAVSLMVLGANGCSQTDRFPLEGTVVLDGQPLTSGFITFRPQAGTSSPTAGGQIQAGRFSIPAAQGTLGGTFHVEITADRETGQTLQDPDSGRSFAAMEQYLPPRYNVESELTAEVKVGHINQFEFALKSNEP